MFPVTRPPSESCAAYDKPMACIMSPSHCPGEYTCMTTLFLNGRPLFLNGRHNRSVGCSKKLKKKLTPAVKAPLVCHRDSDKKEMWTCVTRLMGS